MFWFLGTVGLAIAVPYLVLTVNAQKSSPVAGIFVAPIVLLISGVVAWCTSSRVWKARLQGSTLATLVGVVIIALGLAAQWRHTGVNIRGLPSQAALSGYTQIIDAVGSWVVSHPDQSFHLSLDAHHVEISSTTIQVVLYERSGKWFDIRSGRLGHGPLEETLSQEDVLREAQQSDVLIVTSQRAPWLPDYPLMPA